VGSGRGDGELWAGCLGGISEWAVGRVIGSCHGEWAVGGVIESCYIEWVG
jgi:hypothetical protein